ncbi:Electron transfer DM13 [Cognatiyoonia koreensis]|uniref:Electron transfer DM13 n=1 Tax=Cognatiyoonia koreensis TaxID=364200 RepID=A0A1I0RRT1_9RHOB|nr:DM13 domain-containing protein [Cognatiyoonia koreensis]SEW43932.1 Electron transfer DM13 [Cognatiyoonia koreensis]
MRRIIIGLLTHGMALGVGFGLGIYLLPILTAPPSPDTATLEAMAQDATFTAEIAEDLPGNDFLHWGKGTVSLTPTQIVHTGELAPGPDYMVYLVPEFVDHEDGFERLKSDSVVIGPVKTFKGFALDIPEAVDLEAYTTVVVWCEAFSEFIAAAEYR